MRDKDAPFVVYRRGPGSFYIVPRGAAGWTQLSVLVALLALLVMWFIDHVGLTASGAERSQAVALLVFGLAMWGIGGLWWMLAHAEVVDVAELTRDRQRQARKHQRGEDGS